MRSMTGFGRGEAFTPDGAILFRTELSSVNRKQFELKTFLPKEMLTAEPELRRMVGARISRGSLSLRVEVIFQQGGDSTLAVNRGMMLALLKQLQSIAQEAGLQREPQMENLLQVPGMLEQKAADLADASVMETLKKSCAAALDNLIAMRTSEGENLRCEFEKRLLLLTGLVDRIEPLAAAVPAMQQEKLLRRLAENGLTPDPHDDRVLRELVVFTDRSDVTEEITRLRSHFRHFREFLDNREEALGRNMDFLMQEIFREVNTLGNKAPLPEVSRRIVSMKTEIEKIREQVQNVE